MDAPRSDYKQQVLAAVDIVDLIGKTVPLKRRGKAYLGLCPFHSEKSPSFNVSAERQFFYCFGCKEKGNAIDFVMKRDRLEFLDALKLLGDAAGIERPNVSPQARQAAGQRQQLLDACSTAAGLFQKYLASPAGEAGRAYLAERGFNDEIVQLFQIGLAADAWDALIRADAMRPFGPAVMAMAGLAKPRENGGGYYDTFRNRIMFPIRDETGRIIAFGGRVVPGSTDKAKYLNSPETVLFSKSRTVYGLDLGRQKIVESRTVAVVEGYADVVMAHQYGATNVVSVLGTALTEPHVAILRRFADKIVLLFDADAAGDSAVNRAVELFLTQPVEIAIASLPDGMDPDEFLLAHGAEAFDGILKGAADALTFTWKQMVRQFRANADDLTGQERAVRQYLDVLNKARSGGPVDSLRWGSALARVSRLTEIPVDELNRRFSQSPPPPRLPPDSSGPVPTGPAGPRPAPMVAYQPYPARKPYNPYRPGADSYRSGKGGGFKKSGGPGGSGGPIGAGRGGYGRRDGHQGDGPSILVDHRSVGERPAARTARESAERSILAVLLAEPHRWAGLVDRVHVTDFTSAGRRGLATVYWRHQQDEGEPAFNEFLDVLRAEPAGEDGVTGDGLANLAVELMDEFDARPVDPEGDEGQLIDPGVVLGEAVALLAEMRAAREQDKHLADLRRTSGAAAGATPTSVAESSESLRQLQERARRPDLRRVGS